jgi:starch synthase
LLDWNGLINPLAASVKCAWKFTTVSPSYLAELEVASNGLEELFQMEHNKGLGIINGIDTQVWDPETDPMLMANYNVDNVDEAKALNKEYLCKQFDLDAGKPLFAFIGRLVGEKGADLLPAIINKALHEFKHLNILILGSGDPVVENALSELKERFVGQFNVFVGYNEELSHRIYAGADFLLMPSRVEPCGLNQFYAMRYGTVPVVSNTGGLHDTVIDFSEAEGYGIRFNRAHVDDVCYAISRALLLSKDPQHLKLLRKRMMALDFSWDRSAKDYIDLYLSLKS